MILIFVAQPTHQVGGDLDFRRTTRLDGELGEVVTDVVCEGLRVGGRSGTAAPDVVVELGDFIGRAIGDVRSGGDATV